MAHTAKSYLDKPQGVPVLWRVLGALVLLSLLTWLLPLVGGSLWVYRLPEMLSLRPTLAGFTSQPWGIFTYSLIHQSLLHLLGNLALLYYAGRVFLSLYSVRHLAYVLLGASLFGGGLYVLAYQLLSVLGLPIVPYGLLGASASAYAMLFAVAYSNDRLQISVWGCRMSLMRFAIGLLLLNTLLSLGNFGGHMSHIGGVLVGLLFVRYMQVRKSPVRLLECGGNSVSKAAFDKALKTLRDSGFYSLSEEERKLLWKQKDGDAE